MEARRKIVMLTPWYPSRRSPTSGAFVEVDAGALRKAGHQVTVLACRLPGWLPRRVRDLAFCLIAGFRLAWLDARSQVDIVHAYNVLPAGLLAAIFHQWFGLPCVVVEVTCPFSLHTRGRWSRALVAWVIRNAVTAGCGDDLAQAVKGSLLPCAVDVPPPVPPTRHWGLRVLASGSLTPRKGFDLLPQIWQELHVRDRTRLELVVMGEGPIAPALRAMPGIVRVIPPAPTRQGYLEWLQWADVVLCPSREEGMGLVAAEAAALGKRVIATNVGCHAHVADLILAREPEHWAAALRAMLSLPPGGRPDSSTVRFEYGPGAYAERAGALYSRVAPELPINDGNEPLGIDKRWKDEARPMDRGMSAMFSGLIFCALVIAMPLFMIGKWLHDNQKRV